MSSLTHTVGNRVADYGCGQTCETDFGTVAFDDGVQSWINPALEK